MRISKPGLGKNCLGYRAHGTENKGSERGGGGTGLDWNTYSRGMKAFLALEIFLAVAVLLSDMMLLMVSITEAQEEGVRCRWREFARC